MRLVLSEEPSHIRQGVDKKVDKACDYRKTENIVKYTQRVGRIVYQCMVKISILFQPLHPGGPLVTGFLQIDAALKHDQIHWKVMSPQMSYEEVYGGHMDNRQDSLDAMNP